MTIKLGICISEAVLLPAAQRQQAFKTARLLGATTVRVEIPWANVLTPAIWANYVDPLFADLSAAGLDPLVVIGHPPADATPASLGLFVTALLKRAPALKAIEIYNEMNLSNFGPTDAKVYTPFLIAAYKAAKQVNPAVTVVLGGLAACAKPTWPWSMWNKNSNPGDYLKAVHAAGGEKFYDVVGYHPYSIDDGFRPQVPLPTQKYIALTDTIAGIAARPVWCTEFGFSRKDYSIDAQASNLASELSILKAKPWVERAYVYSLYDVNGEQFGMVDGTVVRAAGNTFSKAATR